VGSDEYAYVVADPLNMDLIYGGKLVRYDRKTGQSQSIAPEALRSGKYRMLRTMPLLFHPADPHILLFATNVLWKTTNGGASWDIISPDLTREKPEVPENIGDFKTPELSTMNRRGVIYSLSASPLEAGIIWAGTDDGYVQVTQDGGTTWKEVSPPELKSWDKVSQLDAGHFDKLTAYMSVNSFRKDDLKPHIYKTHDGGMSWKEIVNGISIRGNSVNVVREDPYQPGLLFAGTEREVYFSIDDGDHWQSLRNNMPATSIRDLVVKENDLVLGTHGRSIWILDNISALRTMAKAISSNKPYLFEPPHAFRIRDNMFHDTPFPPEEPAGQNPPDGAIIDYYLPSANPTAFGSKVSIDILDSAGTIVRHFSSDQEMEKLGNDLPYPTYWIKPFQKLSTSPGHHRFVWDLHHEIPFGTSRELTIAAIYHKTPTSPLGPYVHPGSYIVRLKSGKDQMDQKLEVKLDPRVKMSMIDLQDQTELSMQCYSGYNELQKMKENILLSFASLSPGPKKSELESLVGPGNPDNPGYPL
jgi:hypothetical protein